jgi:hypothetical protein
MLSTRVKHHGAPRLTTSTEASPCLSLDDQVVSAALGRHGSEPIRSLFTRVKRDKGRILGTTRNGASTSLAQLFGCSWPDVTRTKCAGVGEGQTVLIHLAARQDATSLVMPDQPHGHDRGG